MKNKSFVWLQYEGREIFAVAVEHNTLDELRGIKYGIKLAAVMLLPKLWQMGDLNVGHREINTVERGNHERDYGCSDQQ